MELGTDRLTTFLYLLMRDELPAGKVRRCIEQAMAAEAPVFSAPELQALATRYAFDLSGDVVDAGVIDESPAEEEHAPAQAIEAKSYGNSEVFVALGEEELSPAMLKFLDRFDDRIKASPHFMAAINEAAAAGRELDDETARLVGERVRELTAGGAHG